MNYCKIIAIIWEGKYGLDTDSKGIYTEKNAYIISITDPKQRMEETQKIIRNSLRKCESIPLFLWEKTKRMWANLESASWTFLHIQKSRPVWSEMSS